MKAVHPEGSCIGCRAGIAGGGSRARDRCLAINGRVSDGMKLKSWDKVHAGSHFSPDIADGRFTFMLRSFG